MSKKCYVCGKTEEEYASYLKETIASETARYEGMMPMLDDYTERIVKKPLEIDSYPKFVAKTAECYVKLATGATEDFLKKYGYLPKYHYEETKDKGSYTAEEKELLEAAYVVDNTPYEALVYPERCIDHMVQEKKDFQEIIDGLKAENVPARFVGVTIADLPFKVPFCPVCSKLLPPHTKMTSAGH